MLYHERAGADKEGHAGCGGPTEAGRYRHGLTLLSFADSASGRWRQINNRKSHRGANAPGWGFINRGHRHNAVEHYKEQARAANGFSRIRWRARAESVTKAESTLCSARGE